MPQGILASEIVRIECERGSQGLIGFFRLYIFLSESLVRSMGESLTHNLWGYGNESLISLSEGTTLGKAIFFFCKKCWNRHVGFEKASHLPHLSWSTEIFYAIEKSETLICSLQVRNRIRLRMGTPRGWLTFILPSYVIDCEEPGEPHI